MEKETQQREGHPSTQSLLHHRVLPKSDTPSRKKQSPDQEEIEQFLRIVDLFKPRVISTIIVVIATYDYVHTADVIRFLTLMGAAAGYISLRQAIDLLQGRWVLKRREERVSNALPEENAADEQEELE